MGMQEELEKIPCTINKEHKLKLQKYNSKTNQFVLECPDCEKLGFTNLLKGSWKDKKK